MPKGGGWPERYPFPLAAPRCRVRSVEPRRSSVAAGPSTVDLARVTPGPDGRRPVPKGRSKWTESASGTEAGGAQPCGVGPPRDSARSLGEQGTEVLPTARSSDGAPLRHGLSRGPGWARRPAAGGRVPAFFCPLEVVIRAAASSSACRGWRRSVRTRSSGESSLSHRRSAICAGGARIAGRR
jgi:hypothetical protein